MSEVEFECSECGSPNTYLLKSDFGGEYTYDMHCKFCGYVGMTEVLPEEPTEDLVNNPSHYRKHPSGVECIDITEHMDFCLGNAVKYIWRAGLKGDKEVQDLQKAIFYLNRKIKLLEANHNEQRKEVII